MDTKENKSDAMVMVDVIHASSYIEENIKLMLNDDLLAILDQDQKDELGIDIMEDYKKYFKVKQSEIIEKHLSNEEMKEFSEFFKNPIYLKYLKKLDYHKESILFYNNWLGRMENIAANAVMKFHTESYLRTI